MPARGLLSPEGLGDTLSATQKPPGTGERPGVLRVICASRNLTISQYWEAFVACKGQEGEGKVAGSLNAGVREFLTRLMADHQSPTVVGLREVLSRTTFDLPRP